MHLGKGMEFVNRTMLKGRHSHECRKSDRTNNKVNTFTKVKIVSLMYYSHLNIYTLAIMDSLPVSLIINITKEVHH